jgi:hypothetical protein
MISTMDSSENARIVRLERQVDFLFQRLGINPEVALAEDDVLPPALYEAIARGKLIQAIKIYREATGVSLKDAKNAVEALAGKSRRLAGRPASPRIGRFRAAARTVHADEDREDDHQDGDHELPGAGEIMTRPMKHHRDTGHHRLAPTRG